jgi:hypothetical protein
MHWSPIPIGRLVSTSTTRSFPLDVEKAPRRSSGRLRWPLVSNGVVVMITLV